jgi:hypothetical protein
MFVFKRCQWRIKRYGSKAIPFNEHGQDDDHQDKLQEIDFKRRKLIPENDYNDDDDDELTIPIQQKRYRASSIVDLSKQSVNNCAAENAINRPHVDINNVQDDEEGKGKSTTKWEHETSLGGDESNGIINFGDEINVISQEKDNVKGEAPSNISNSYLVNIQDHFPSQIRPTAKKKYPQRRCVICKGNGKTRDCRYYCKSCFERPALCKSSCFLQYHCNIYSLLNK